MGVGRDRKDRNQVEKTQVLDLTKKKSSIEDVGVGRDQKDRNQVQKAWMLDVTEKTNQVKKT